MFDRASDLQPAGAALERGAGEVAGLGAQAGETTARLAVGQPARNGHAGRRDGERDVLDDLLSADRGGEVLDLEDRAHAGAPR